MKLVYVLHQTWTRPFHQVVFTAREGWQQGRRKKKKDTISCESIPLRPKAIGCVTISAVFPEASEASVLIQILIHWETIHDWFGWHTVQLKDCKSQAAPVLGMISCGTSETHRLCLRVFHSYPQHNCYSKHSKNAEFINNLSQTLNYECCMWAKGGKWTWTSMFTW